MSDAPAHSNSILASLSEADWDKMKASFREIPLNYGAVLQPADEPLHHLYFPTLGVVSTVALFENGTSVEMATIGVEGMVSMGLFSAASAQSAGMSSRSPAKPWQLTLMRSGTGSR
jgi:hypothetical protein